MESDVEEHSKHLGESPKKSASHDHQNSRSHEGHVSSRSQRSHLSAWEQDHTNPDEDWTLSQSSLKSSSRKSGIRNKSQSSSWDKYGRTQERNGTEESDHSYNQDVDQLSVPEEIEESINETSMDETSLSTSTCTSKENGSSSELSIDPVIWKKFKFLTSILKETQHNLKEMDNLVFEHRRMQELANLPPEEALIAPAVSHIPGAEQALGDGEPKTDEAKLEEILSLLHNLTRTLSSYEQHPLLANAQQSPGIPVREKSESYSGYLGEHPQYLDVSKKSESQRYGSHNLDSHTYHLIEPRHTTSDESSKLQVTDNENQDQGSSQKPPRTEVSRDGLLNYANTSSRYSSSIPHAVPQGLNVNSNPTYTNVGILSLENEPRMPSQPYPHSSHMDNGKPISTGDIHITASDSSYFYNTHKKDSINQTDYAFSGPSANESSEAFFNRSYQPRTAQHSEGISSYHSQGLDHPLTKETRSLRKDINDIVIRKQALDSRLQSLIAHRAMQRELEMAQTAKSKDKKSLRMSQSLEDDDRKLKGRIKKYRSRSRSQEDEEDSHNKITSSYRDSYLSMISEDQDEFPSLQMGSLENEEKISDLRNEEADLPGIGDSGLSSEINSINATIQELVRENQQLHGFLQGMTVESIAKVDQEKVELEAKIQSLHQENESLKIIVKGQSEEETEASAKKKHDGKSVSFLVSEDSIEELLKRNEIESDHGREIDVKFLRRSTEQNENNCSHATSLNNGQQILVTEEHDLGHAERIAALEEQVNELTKQNQDLTLEIREAKNEAVNDKELQSDVEETSSSILMFQTEDISNLNVTKEIEKLQRKIKRLLLEKDELNIKLNKEATERDFESSRLEARIRILSEQNKALSDKLDEKILDSLGAENHVDHSSTSDNQKISRKSIGDSKYENTNVISSKEVSFKDNIHYHNRGEKSEYSSSKGDPEDSISKNSVDKSSFQKDFEYSNTQTCTGNSTSKDDSQRVYTDYSHTEADSEHLRSLTESSYSQINETKESLSEKKSGYSKRDTEYSTTSSSKYRQISDNDDGVSPSQSSHTGKGLIADDPDTSSKKNIAFDKDDGHIKPGSTTDVEHNFHSRTFLFDDSRNAWDGLQGEGTVKTDADKVNQLTILQPVNDPKLMSQLEELLKQNEMLIQTVNTMKATTTISESSLETVVKQIMEEHNRLMQNIDKKLASDKLSKELDTLSRMNKLLQEKQELASTLEEQKDQIKSLVDKNDLLERKLELIGNENQEMLDNSQGNEENDKEILCYVKTPPSLCIATEEKNTPYDIEVDCEIIESFSVKEETGEKHDKRKTDDMNESDYSAKTTHFVQNKKIHKTLDLQNQPPLSDSESKSNSRRNSLTLHLSSQIASLTSSSRIFPKGEVQEMQKERQEALREEMLDLSMRKEDEKWAQVLNQAGMTNLTEVEKEILQERIKTLVSENDCLASRLEEVVGVSRNLSDQMQSAREELIKISAEKEDLQKKVRSLEEGKEDSSVSLSESFGSSRLTQRLKDRIRSLQGEVEQALQEVHQRTIERDKIAAERESLEYTANINLNSARNEIEFLKRQLNMQQTDFDRKAIELTNTKNELEKKSSDQKQLQDDFEIQKKKQYEIERKLEAIDFAYKECQEKLQLEVTERKAAEERLEEALHRFSAGMDSEKTKSKGDRYWQEAVSRLKNRLHQEQLRSRLLEAADQENSARIVALQRNVRENIEAYETLQAKYKQLRTAYRAKKTDKIHHRELSQKYSQQVQELGKTSAALEDNYKMMLSTLGENIGVTVEILTSHVFLSPCVVHPSPDIRLDMEAWFEAQQSRLRWLQTQLRKLCLHSWKMADIPKTSNLSIEEKSHDHASSGESFGAQRKDGGSESSYNRRKSMQRNLHDLSILDDTKSYSSSPTQKRGNKSGTVSASGASLSFISTSDTDGKATKDENCQESGNTHVSFSLVHAKPSISIKPLSSSTMSLSEVGRIITDQQRQLTRAKFQQYKTLVSSLQRELEYSLASSPSVPSSMITTPEKIRELSPSTVDDEEHSEDVEVTLSESQMSSSRTLCSVSQNESASAEQATSVSKESSPELATSGTISGTSKSYEERNISSSTPIQQEVSEEYVEEFIMKNGSGQSYSRTSTSDSNHTSRIREMVKEKSSGVDVDKDHDSMEELDEEEDIIRIFVESEIVDDDLD